MNVTLIGMAAAGKTHIGKHLAQRLSLDFIDIDDLLEETYKKPIQALLEEVGEEKYLDLEAQMLIDSTRDRDNMLISPGGSIIYRDTAMRHVHDTSKVIYLKVPFEVIESRKKGAAPRAVIGLGTKSLRELYDERHPLYEKNADFTIEPTALSNDEVLRTIAEYLARR